MKNLIKTHLQQTNQEKATYGTYDVSLVVIHQGEEQWLPDELCVITRTPDKMAIKAHMEDGKLTTIVDGKTIELAHLESDQTIRIK